MIHMPIYRQRIVVSVLTGRHPVYVFKEQLSRAVHELKKPSEVEIFDDKNTKMRKTEE